jgi:hypothetical protein
MKLPPIALASLALLAFSNSQSFAACLDEIARLSPGTTTSSDPSTTAGVQQQGRVSKDGTHAPLESASTGGKQSGGSVGSSQSASASTNQGVSKDGSTMPLASKPGEGSSAVATSQQDAQAQQRGGQTAATAGQAQMSGQHSSGYHSPQMMAALDRARGLAQRGDEAGCMQAVQDAKRLGQ